jgi:hypothetical protein
MEVAEEYVPNASLLRQRESGSDRAGIQKQGVIDEKSTRLLAYRSTGSADELIGAVTP